MDFQADLLVEIETFLAQHGGMSETTFGKMAVNDGKLVGRLRSGANMTIATIARVRSFLRDQAVAAPSPPTTPKRRKRAPVRHTPPAESAPETTLESPGPKRDEAA